MPDFVDRYSFIMVEYENVSSDCSRQFALKENYGDHYTTSYKAATSDYEAIA